MAQMELKRPVTIDDMYHMPKDGRKYELVDGEILVSPGNWQHSKIATKFSHIIATFLERSPQGTVVADNLGVILPNGNLRSPDTTFVRTEKLPPEEASDKFADFVPDLVVEVLSPDDRPSRVAAKIAEFLESGVSIVWVADPKQKTVTVYRSFSNTEQYGPDDTITAEPVLQGFSCLVARFFE
jgi:Uma2 family endonuclease